MRALIRLVALAAGATILTLTPFSTASAGQGEAVFVTFFYSDASKTQEVGYILESCEPGGVVPGSLVGQTGPYERTEMFGLCFNGELILTI